jgi:hypothetical protein
LTATKEAAREAKKKENRGGQSAEAKETKELLLSSQRRVAYEGDGYSRLVANIPYYMKLVLYKTPANITAASV